MCINSNCLSHEVLPPSWSVNSILDKIATAEPHYHALIDTGALVTGMSNYDVAKYLLDHGLKYAEGVVFLDDEDKQQVKQISITSLHQYYLPTASNAIRYVYFF